MYLKLFQIWSSLRFNNLLRQTSQAADKETEDSERIDFSTQPAEVEPMSILSTTKYTLSL